MSLVPAEVGKNTRNAVEINMKYLFFKIKTLLTVKFDKEGFVCFLFKKKKFLV